MNILFSLGNNKIKKYYAPKHIIDKIEQLGNITYNPYDNPFSKDQLIKAIKDIDIIITHWSCPKIDNSILKYANKLKLIAHGAGSVQGLIDESVFDENIKVISSNNVMAKYVAESVLSNILTSLQKTIYFTNLMSKGLWKNMPSDYSIVKSLYNSKVSFIGFGAVGHYLFNLMKPFNINHLIYDPYFNNPNYNISNNLNEVLAYGDIVTLHASLTDETIRMLDSENLKFIKDGALFINTARGQIVNEKALIEQLDSKRISASLDVYENEPLESNNILRNLNNVIALPHISGVAAKDEYMEAIIKDISNFINNRPLEYEVSKEKWALMTKWV